MNRFRGSISGVLNGILGDSQARDSSKHSSQTTFTPPATVEISQTWSIYDILVDRAKRKPDDLLYEYKDKQSNKFLSLTATQVLEKVQRIAVGLQKSDVKPGDKVAIMAKTSLEWILLDFAIYACGGICVPIYDTSSREQVHHIIKDTKTKFAVTGTAEIAEKFKGLKALSIHIIEEGAVDALEALGKSEQNVQEIVDDVQKTISAKDVAIIVYTSGSTGVPKGVVLTHQAVLSISYDTQMALPELICVDDAKLLLFLPLAHGFAHFAQFAITGSKASLAITGEIATLIQDLQTVKPTVLLGVPRIFEKVFNAASHKASNGVSKIIFSRAVKTAVEYSKMLDKKKTPQVYQSKRELALTLQQETTLQAKHRLYKLLLYDKILNVLGGKAFWAISGGAPLNSEINHFFRGAGLIILEGYGMTETVAPICVNRPSFNKIGTIGLPFPGVKALQAKDGELILNTPYTFVEYNGNPAATNEVLIKSAPEYVAQSGVQTPVDTRWLATGDLCEIDQQGFIKIVGRKKEMLVTAGGKNVSPAPLEAQIDADPLVAQSVVIGDGHPFIAALVCLEMDEVDKWCDRLKRPHFTNMLEASSDAAVLEHIQRAIDKANEMVSRAESVRRFRVVHTPFSEKDNTLTASMKIRRRHIIEKYRDDVDIIYKTPREKSTIGLTKGTV